MNISEICIKRPVLALVLSLVLVVVGIMGFNDLNTRFFPKFEQNVINISTAYPSASAKLVESSITTPLEEGISGVQGIDTIISQSFQGESDIKLTLDYGVNVYEVANQIRDKVEQARVQLPTNINAPVVQVGWGNMELMDVGFTAPNENPKAIRDYLERNVIDQIEQIPGIADVEVAGANQYAMRIWLDPQKMAARGLSVNDVQMAIQNSNVELPAGEIKGSSINYPITAETKLNTADQFNNIIVKNDNGQVIRIKDIGQAQLDDDSADQSIVTLDGQPGVLLSINNATDANPLDAAKNVNHFLNQIRPHLPNGMKIVPSFDISAYMHGSIHEVYISIGIAILCVILVIFLFLGRLRTVAIPIATIPVCLIASFGAMYLLGFSINVITLLALVLSIGLVVDDAIVMLENIYRHIENGEKPLIAAIKGSKEITFPVIAMTITLAAVYAPIGLMQNQAANIFRSFAFTLAGAVLISGFVALSLSPMMCSRFLKAQGGEPKGYSRIIETIYERMAQGYQKILAAILNKRILVVFAAVLIAVGGFFLAKNIPMAFVPQEDMGFVIAAVSTSSGSSINTINRGLEQVASIFKQAPAVASVVTVADTNAKAFDSVFAMLKPFKDRKQSASQVADVINQKIKQIPGLNAAAFAPSFGGSMQHQLEFYLMGDTYSDLYAVSQKLINQLGNYPGLRVIQSNMRFDSQQYNMTVNRDIAGQLQANIKDIDNTMAALYGGSKISTFDANGKTYNVYLQAQENDLHSLASINKFYVNNAQNKLIPLSNLISIKPILSQVVLPHYNHLRAAQMSAQLAPGYNLGTVVNYLQTELPQLLPANVKYAFTGQAHDLLTSNNSMGLIFLLAMVFIYLVLAAQFESFIDPFIILLAVPLSIVGAMASLKLIGGTLNIYTDIGLVTLIGLVSKHGILITQFANRLQKEGLAMREALLKAASIRLRPILMTTAAMVFGALPLLFSSGGSAQSRHQIGIVIIGGLIFGTLFSLVVVPVAYSYAYKFKLFLKRFKTTDEMSLSGK
ncbi:efflux RND transporter permease subunit [Coxiella burnetii]|uniref:efflux RND transporter permease subunit n=1 Tax=Coxiella burnetii TaxID=777 RepID=UPI000CCC1CE5|nr:efflux RND transporter permease subunit [Coxiella burnetii]PNT90221.1 AcrB/AcrD/AcrF family protein [Coxiella burnetii]